MEITKDTLIEPIQRIKFGICPMCGNYYYLKNEEYTILLLDENGVPLRTKYDGSVCADTLICDKCGYSEPAVRVKNYYVPESAYYRVKAELDNKEEKPLSREFEYGNKLEGDINYFSKER